MMKEHYEDAQLEVIPFRVADIIATSLLPDDTLDDDELPAVTVPQ